MSAEIGGLPPVCEVFRLPRNASIARSMNTPSHDFVTVEMRGLKAALVARAQSERVSVSALVRAAVARDLELADVAELGRPVDPAGAASRAGCALCAALGRLGTLQPAAPGRRFRTFAAAWTSKGKSTANAMR